MGDAWDDKRKAAEESYFEKKEQEALKNAKTRGVTSVRKSPITGEPMETITLEGVTVDRCPSSGGIWLDKGELEQIIQSAQSKTQAGHTSWLGNLLSDLMKVKP